MRGTPRPDAAARIVDRVKLHRHLVRLEGEDYTVITPRAGVDVRFSTNRYHETWHIVSDLRGARLLSRLLWGLAYQRVPRTLVLIDRPFLDSNPFDAAVSDPIALVPARLTPMRDGSARVLRRRLPLTQPAGTVRWHTAGLDRAIEAERLAMDRRFDGYDEPYIEPRGFQYRVHRLGGLIVFAATSEELKRWAIDVFRLGTHLYHGTADAEIGYPDGEVQVFTNYRQRVSAARVARREVLATMTEPVTVADLEPLVWDRGTAVRQRRGRAAAGGRRAG